MASDAALPAARRHRRERPAAPPGPWPWLDRGGRFSPFKAAVLALCLAPMLWLLWLWASDGLGPEPATRATHLTGEWTIRFLLLSLLVTPARHVLDLPRVLQVRRILGLAALGYVLAHLLLYVTQENGRLLHVLLEIVKRPYLSVGITAVIGLAVLGWTSTDGAIRRLGREWRPLHRLAYPVTALGILHFHMQSKVDVSEPVLMSGLFLWLMLWRLLPAPWRGSTRPLFLLAPLAALGAAGLEYLWYATQTRVPAGQVLAANLDFEFEWRPAVWVLVTGLGAWAVAAAWRALPARASRAA